MALVRDQSGFIERFVHARTSWGFIASLALWIGGWIAWQYVPGLPHFDMPPANEKFGLLNFLLSIEATLSMPILWMGMERAAEKDRLATEQRHNTEMSAMREVLAATRDLVARLSEVGEDVEAIEVHVAEIADTVTTEE